MKKAILIVSLLVLSSFTAISQIWEFIPNSEFIPVKNSIFNNNEEWLPKDIIFNNGFTIITRSLYGVALYKDRKWTYWSPEYIKEHIINTDALNYLDFKYINIYKALADSQGNLWLMADSYLLKYNSDGFYCYYQYKDTNNNVHRISTINGINIQNEYVSVKVLYYEEKDGMIKLNKTNCKINSNNEIEVIYNYPDLYILSCSKIYPYITDSFNNTYQTSNNIIRIIDTNGIVENLQLYPADQPKIAAVNTLNRNDTIIIQNNKLVLSKVYKNNIFSIDSTIRNLENILHANTSLALDWYIQTSLSTVGMDGDLYYMPNANEDIADSIPTRIFQYKSENNATDILIPVIPGQTTKIPASNFAVDSLGRIWIIYADYGIYIYYPEGLGIENEISVDYYPRIWIWKLFPNPAQETARIEFHLTRDVKNECKIQIIDVMGNVVKDIKEKLEYNEQSQEAVINFSTSDIATGTYYVTISSGKSKKLKQLQIVR